MRPPQPGDRRPRVQWLMLAGDVLGAAFLAALIVALFWLVPIGDALVLEAKQ